MSRFFILLALNIAIFPVAGISSFEIPLTLQPESSILIEGNSTLHAFESRSKVLKVSSSVILSQALPAKTLLADLVKAGRSFSPRLAKMILTVPVQSLKSPSFGLDGNLHKALKSREHPEITFRLVSSPETIPSGPETLLVKATGDLTIAGTTRRIDIEAEVKPDGQTVIVRGKYELLMTDYGVKPPNLLAGRIVVEDKITVTWHLIFGLEPAAAGR